MTVYDNVKALCDKQDMTIMELERRAEVGNGVVGRWRKSVPNLTNLLKVAKVLGVGIEELVG